jgi:hypothetical protein
VGEGEGMLPHFLSARGNAFGPHGRVLGLGYTKTCGRSFDKLRMTPGEAFVARRGGPFDSAQDGSASPTDEVGPDARSALIKRSYNEREDGRRSQSAATRRPGSGHAGGTPNMYSCETKPTFRSIGECGLY